MQLGDTYAVFIHKLRSQILPRSIDKHPAEDELQEDEPVILEPPATKARDSFFVGSYVSDVHGIATMDP